MESTQCASCQQKFKFKPSLAGKKCKCPKCKEPMVLPCNSDVLELTEIDTAPQTHPVTIFVGLIAAAVFSLIVLAVFVESQSILSGGDGSEANFLTNGAGYLIIGAVILVIPFAAMVYLYRVFSP